MKIALSSTGPDIDADIDPRFGRCAYFVIVDGESMEVEALENPNVMAAGGAGIQAAQLVASKGAGVVLTGHCGPNAFQTLKAAGIPVCVGVSGAVREAVEHYKKGEILPAGGPNAANKAGVGATGGQDPHAGGFEPRTGTGMSRGPGIDGGPGAGGGWSAAGGGPGTAGGPGPGGGAGPGGGPGAGLGRGLGRGMGRRPGRGLGRRMSGQGAWSPGWGGALGERIPFAGIDGTGPEGFHAEDLGMLKAEARELRNELGRLRQRIEEIEKGGGDDA